MRRTVASLLCSPTYLSYTSKYWNLNCCIGLNWITDYWRRCALRSALCRCGREGKYPHFLLVLGCWSLVMPVHIQFSKKLSLEPCNISELFEQPGTWRCHVIQAGSQKQIWLLSFVTKKIKIFVNGKEISYETPKTLIEAWKRIPTCKPFFSECCSCEIQKHNKNVELQETIVSGRYTGFIACLFLYFCRSSVNRQAHIYDQ